VTLTDLIVELQDALSSEWHSLVKARSEAHRVQGELERVLGPTSDGDVSFVVLGSLAREEFTRGSDIDWTLLVDGQANAGHLDLAFAARDAVETVGLQPRQGGTFGQLAFSHDIVQRIGGFEDTNQNLTQRILLLLESRCLGNSDAYDRVRNAVTKRYVVEDFGWIHKGQRIPRFLLNDIARYWRTVAVDFAFKRRERQGDGWALRTIKLRMSRKLTFTSGLISCFSCADAEIGQPPNGDPAVPQPLVKHLSERFSLTPLESVAAIVLQHESLHRAGRAIFDSYDRFLEILNDEEQRTHLEQLAPADAADDPAYDAARAISHDFQSGLTELFLSDSSPLKDLTLQYGIF
jgi:predicted nucleotidyltransferase